MLMFVEGGLRRAAKHQHAKVKTAANLCCARLRDRTAAIVHCQDTPLYCRDI